MNNGNERGVERPNSAGPWLWREAGHKDAVELLLTEDGGEVAGVDDAEEGTPQYYWERTPTDKRHMPGQWHLPPNADYDVRERMAVLEKPASAQFRRASPAAEGAQ